MILRAKNVAIESHKLVVQLGGVIHHTLYGGYQLFIPDQQISACMHVNEDVDVYFTHSDQQIAFNHRTGHVFSGWFNKEYELRMK